MMQEKAKSEPKIVPIKVQLEEQDGKPNWKGLPDEIKILLMKKVEVKN